MKARAHSTSEPTNSVVGLTVNISSPSDQNTPPTVVGSTLSISSQSDQNTPPTGTDVSDNQAVTIVVSIIAVLAAIIGIIGCVVRLYQKWHQNGDTGPDESSSDIFIAGNPWTQWGKMRLCVETMYLGFLAFEFILFKDQVGVYFGLSMEGEFIF